MNSTAGRSTRPSRSTPGLFDRESQPVWLLGLACAAMATTPAAAQYVLNDALIEVRLPTSGWAPAPSPGTPVPAVSRSAGLLLGTPLPLGGSTLSITINFDGGLTPSQEAVFSSARNTWEQALRGYQPGISLAGPTITAKGVAIDGPGKVLGQAGPTVGWVESGYLLTYEGEMKFDTDDLAWMETAGVLEEVILHEMAHVLGFGTLWNLTINSTLYNDVRPVTGQYTGANALNQYRLEFNQPGATYVPVELGGEGGTANSHWDEEDGGAALTGITQVGTGNDMAFELMTGWLNSPTFLSQTTLESFRDIGFTPVPEPAAAAGAFALGIVGFALWRRSSRSA